MAETERKTTHMTWKLGEETEHKMCNVNRLEKMCIWVGLLNLVLVLQTEYKTVDSNFPRFRYIPYISCVGHLLAAES